MNLTQALRKLHLQTLTVGLSSAVVLTIALVAGPFAQSAAAVTCRNTLEVPPNSSSAFGFEDPATGYDYYWDSTHASQVPGSDVSGCVDVNVDNIIGGSGTGGHCAHFRVGYGPTYNSPATYTSYSYVCSSSSSQVVSIWNNAPAGYYYIVYHTHQDLIYTVRD